MAILIADPNSKTRQTLRKMLTSLGHQTILEAKNSEEAFKLMQIQKSRIRLILSDLQMPQMDGLEFLKKVSESPSLNLAPFLLMTSGLFDSHFKKIKKNSERIDGFLGKPFGQSRLAQSIQQASIHRAKCRYKILFFGETVPTAFAQALDKSQALKRFKIQSKIETIRSLENFEHSRKIYFNFSGAWLIDVSSISAEDQVALRKEVLKFKKTPLGTLTPIVCLHRNSQTLSLFRGLCERYWNPTQKTQDWIQLLNEIEAQKNSAWEIEFLFHYVKPSLQQKNWEKAWKVVQSMLTLSPAHPDVHTLAGDVLGSMNRFPKAVQHYEIAIELNPTHPRPYIQLFLLAQKGDFLPRPEQIESATQYCPKNADVFFTAAVLQKKLGDYPQAQALLYSLLEVNPWHTKARSLLKALC